MKTQITSALTHAQTQLFLRDGFLALEQITSPEAVQSLKPAFERLFQSRAGRERGMHFDFAGTDEDDASFGLPQIMSPSRFVPALLRTELMANARSIAVQILGSRIEFTLDHALLKPAHSGAMTPWHQDEAFSSPEWDLDQVSFWIPLQKATADNGCLRFIPGSHKGGVLPHRSFRDDPRIHALECYEGFDRTTEVICPILPGSADRPPLPNSPCRRSEHYPTCTVRLRHRIQCTGSPPSEPPRVPLARDQEHRKTAPRRQIS